MFFRVDTDRFSSPHLINDKRGANAGPLGSLLPKRPPPVGPTAPSLKPTTSLRFQQFRLDISVEDRCVKVNLRPRTNLSFVKVAIFHNSSCILLLFFITI